MQTCMICQKTGRMCYNVFTDYENINHTIRDDMVEIFGVDVEPYLSPKDFLCGMCMAMLENIAKLKRRLWPLICHHNQDCRPISLGRIWDIFASLKFEDEGDEEDHIACRTPTPSKLLTLNYSKAYNDRLENEIANVERHRSLSRASSGFCRSDVSETSEVRNILSKKRKRRNGRKNWTRHKRNARSPATSEFSSRSYPLVHHSRRSDFEHSVSPLSDCSYVSFYKVKKSPVKKKRGVEYDEEGRLVKKRTRSISRAQEEEAKYLEILDNNKHYCGEKDCLLYFEDVDVLNHHRMKHHKLLALHFCGECSQRYTTAEHLKLHKKSHDVYPFLCPLCACDVKNQEALQEHLEEHMTYSVPCKYCDKSFLSRKACETHHKSAHTSRTERIIHKNKIIIARLDKDQDGIRNDSDPRCSSSDQYSVHILHYTDMEYDSNDLDITEENFTAMGMEFIVDEDDESLSDESELLSEPPSKLSDPPSQSNVEEEPLVSDNVVEEEV